MFEGLFQDCEQILIKFMEVGYSSSKNDKLCV